MPDFYKNINVILSAFLRVIFKIGVLNTFKWGYLDGWNISGNNRDINII